MTVKAFLEQWIRDTVMVSDRAPATKAKHEIAVGVHLVPGLGRVQLAKLTPMRVQTSTTSPPPMFDAAADAISRAVGADANGSNGSSDPAIGSKNGSKTTDSPAPGDGPPAATSPLTRGFVEWS